MAFLDNILGDDGNIDLSIFADVAFSGDFNDLINVPSFFNPGLQEVTDINAITTNSITVGGLTAGNLFSDGYIFGISDNFDSNYNFLYVPYVGLTLDDFSGNQSILMPSGLQLNSGLLSYSGPGALWSLPSSSGTLALTSDIPSLSGYLTTSDAASIYFPIPIGTTSQYIRGDGTLATFPSYSVPSLNDVTSVSNISFNSIELRNNVNTSRTEIGWNGFGFREGSFFGTFFQPLTPITQLATIYVPNTPGIMALISDIPTIATDLDALKRDGSNANIDVDLGDFAIKAKEVVTQTNGSTKKMILKSNNVDTEHTAEWQNKDYDGIADINDITNALATFKTDEFLDATSSIQGQLDSKQSLLGFTPENITNKSSSYTASSTTTYTNTKALVDGLATKQDALTYTPYKFVQTSQTLHTGTILETIVATATIQGGTFNTNDVMKAIFKCTKVVSTSNVIMRLKINTSNTLTLSTNIATLIFTTSNLYAKMKRDYDLNGGNLYGYSFASSLTNDDTNTNTLPNATAYNTANTLYFFWTVQLGTSLDSVTPNLANLTN